MQESQGVTFDSHVSIKGEGVLDGSLSDIQTDIKRECFVDESNTHTTEVQKQKQESEPEYELSSTSTTSNFSLDSVPVIIKEELILEDTDGEQLVDKVLYNIIPGTVILM